MNLQRDFGDDLWSRLLGLMRIHDDQVMNYRLGSCFSRDFGIGGDDSPMVVIGSFFSKSRVLDERKNGCISPVNEEQGNGFS